MANTTRGAHFFRAPLPRNTKFWAICHAPRCSLFSVLNESDRAEHSGELTCISNFLDEAPAELSKVPISGIPCLTCHAVRVHQQYKLRRDIQVVFDIMTECRTHDVPNSIHDHAMLRAFSLRDKLEYLVCTTGKER
ncbi:hypothetical protein Hypma_001290 [Hypsizygus marmoreus]|uniref:Uncharacterized protein n=1 Tax=Hypsizygus marmoreus TaxID=39966 RepID=A0A369K8M6_HYPMA|nr:hypothetical protein Hypma_001290 [Hypsizygus marmoreus]